MKNSIIVTDLLPRFNADYGHGTPIRTVGAYRIATALSDVGCDTRVIDYFFHIDFESQVRILSNLINSDTVIFGISATNARGHTKTLAQHSLFDKFKPLPNRSNSVFYFHESIERLIDHIRSQYPHVKIIVGGGQSTNIKNKAFEYIDRNIDFYFTGDSDIAVQKLYRHLVYGDDLTTYNKWKDTYVFNHTKIIHSEVDYPLTNDHAANSLAIDNQKIKSYFTPNEWGFVEISRGCIYNCHFCSYRHSNKMRSVESIREEIIRNYETFGTTRFRLMDDTFNDSRRKVDKLCNMFINLPFKIEWHSYARTDVLNVFPDLIDLMYESGCRYLKFGLESTSNEALKYANKGSHNVAHEKAEWVIDEIYKRTGGNLYTHSNFIIGLPGETVESQRKTFEWIKNSKLKTVSFTTYFRDQYDSKFAKVKEYSEYAKDSVAGLTGFGNEWVHNTMTSTQAYELYNEAFQFFKDSNSAPYWVGSDIYPYLRTYGVPHDDVDRYMFSIFKSYYDEQAGDNVKSWLTDKFKEHVFTYFKNIDDQITMDSILALKP